MTTDQILEADELLRTRLAQLFWQRSIDPNNQALDDVAQECWLVMLAKQCLNKPFIFCVAKISVARMVERQARKREQSYNVQRSDGKAWVDVLADNPNRSVGGDADSLIAAITDKRLRKTAEAIVSTRTFADARRQLGVTKTTMQRHRANLRDVLPVPTFPNQRSTSTAK